MNRICLFLCFLCIPWVARGQSAYEWTYWFDEDGDMRQTGKTLTPVFSIKSDVGELSEGFHFVHVQVADTAGRYSPPQTQIFYRTNDRSIKKLHYWFDTDSERVYSIDHPADHVTIDLGDMRPGIHVIYCQAEDAQGVLTDVVSRCFYRQVSNHDTAWSYWFDEDATVKHTVPYAGDVVAIDVSQLADGFHTIHSQIGEYAPTDIITRMFLKVPQTENAGDLTCICTVDEKLVAQDKVPSSGGVLSWDMDVNALDMGIHKAMFQVLTPTGAASTIAERYFVRAITNQELGSMKCVYALDNFETHYQAGTLSNGLFHFDLDVASMEDGVHRLAYWLVSENGVSTPQQTAFFWKTPVGGEGVTQYHYWVNENDDQKHIVQFDEHQNPFSLIALLPVERQPIRSSNFQFAVKNGTPLIYARNEFHIQFFDTNGRMVEETHEYNDEQVSQKVVPVDELYNTQTFSKVAENDIRWYTMQSAPGDTAAFRLSQAATLQVFAPSGKEVFNASGSASVQWAGIHTWENGTYYLAVHDVTGSKTDMTLDYMHLDKYDVVDWDVHTVGNGGCSTITFKGNGFHDLYAVDLVIAKSDTIHSVDVSHDSDAETAVTFDFTDAKLGDYNAVFHFTEGDKRMAKVVTVEEAVDIELATNVSFPSTFLSGTSTTYTIKITNKGNMTAYQVPLELMLRVSSINNISNIAFDGYLKSMTLPELPDSIDKEELELLREVVNDANDLCQFIIYTDSIEHRDYGMSQIILSLPPNATKQFTVTIKSSSVVELHAYMTESWFPMSIAHNRNLIKYKARKSDRVSKFCCVKERWQCAADAIAYVAGYFGGNANCAAASLSAVFNTATDVWCSEGSNISERFNNYVKSQGASLANRLINTLVNCVIGYYKPIVEGLRESRKLAVAMHNVTEVNRISEQIRGVQQLMYNDLARIYKGVNTAISGQGCIQAWTKTKPGCPPTDGGGGSSTPAPPSDPNDIYGYLSETGSKFIADSVARVNYTIEFENDTTFAQASAHTIVICDTLDSKVFDLTQFVPTGIKLGGREVFLDETDVVTKSGVTSFVKTIDVRPEINAIAQVEGKYIQKTGIATWTFTSLDPMTMEPTDDLMQGILPVNYDGTSGIGEVMFEVGVKPNKGDGKEVRNRAGIVFDYEESILTPTWVNTVDAVAPTSRITEAEQVEGDSHLTLHWTGEDARSGIWYYDVYAQMGAGSSWELVAEHVTATECNVRVYEDIEYGFCVVATDMAGNRERKALQNELLPDNTTGVETVGSESNPTSGELYDLSGRRSDGRRTGVYIQGGKLWYFKR